MHHDIIQIEDVKHPKWEVNIAYFSSHSNNTHRFIQKLDFNNTYRIPVDLEEKIDVNKPYILFCPTYAGWSGDTKWAVPKQVIQFLNNIENRKNCYGVVPSGNMNFNDTFCLAGPILSKKLGAPILYQYELLWTQDDVKNVEKILNNFFITN